MGKLQVRNVVIGEGIPKICVPIVGTSVEEILAQAKKLTTMSVDMVEWRCDWVSEIEKYDEKFTCILKLLRKILGEMPILVTFRTKTEGGEQDILWDDYVRLYQTAMSTGMVDLIDLELAFCQAHEQETKNLLEEAKKEHVAVIMSSHDFCGTPETEVLLEKLKQMAAFGADILKIAVMPKNSKDVLKLLCASQEMAAMAKQPVIAMSMGGLGVVSRISGEIFGSAVTFGAVTKASAPGQMQVDVLAQILEELHKNLY